MVTDKQVRRLMKLNQIEQNLSLAAAKSGMSEEVIVCDEREKVSIEELTSGSRRKEVSVIRGRIVPPRRE